jgi:hypothetical protein
LPGGDDFSVLLPLYHMNGNSEYFSTVHPQMLVVVQFG